MIATILSGSLTMLLFFSTMLLYATGDGFRGILMFGMTFVFAVLTMLEYHTSR